MSDNEVTGKQLYEYKIKSNKTWAEIGREFGITQDMAKGRAQRYYNNAGKPPPSKAKITGSIAQEEEPDKSELWDIAIRRQERTDRTRQQRQNRRVAYPADPTVLLFIADMHLGSPDVDYRAIDEDIRLIDSIAKTGVNVGVVLAGDLIDNFIIGKLQSLRMNTSPFLAVEEWDLVDYALERLAPYIIGSVAGNHDNWSWAVAGVDILRSRHRELTPGIMYDPYELSFTLSVGSFDARIIVRHSWKGRSKYNPTHGMEDHHWTRGRDFDVAVGAHTHRGGLAREIDLGGYVGYALICGTYKSEDSLGKKLGLPPVLPTSAVALVVDGDGIQFATSNLYALPRLFS